MIAVRRIGSFLGRYYSIFLLLLLYELISRSGMVSPRLLPSLVSIGEQLWRYLANGQLIMHAQVTLTRTFVGFGLALVFGIILGTAMARSAWIERLVEPIFYFGYPIPKIALYPVFIFVFGLGTGSTIALVCLECLYPITIHVHSGIRSVDRILIWAARSMGATRRDVFWRVLVPGALPIFFTGLRIALPVALIITIVTEIIGESQGLGYFVTYASASFQYARGMAAFLLIALIGFALDRGVRAVRRRVVFWQPPDIEIR
jgi:NitT/TauT family transport system permease protein